MIGEESLQNLSRIIKANKEFEADLEKNEEQKSIEFLDIDEDFDGIAAMIDS